MHLRKPNKEKSLPSNFETKLQRIRKLAPPPPTEAIYPYLQAVYRQARKLGQIDGPKEKELNKLADSIPARFKFNRMRFLIELTAPEYMKPKMKWKYGQVLLYARDRRVKSTDLIEFIKGEGGINECIKKYEPSKTH